MIHRVFQAQRFDQTWQVDTLSLLNLSEYAQNVENKISWHPSWFSTCHFTLAIVETSWKYISLHSPSYHINTNYIWRASVLKQKTEKKHLHPCRPSTHLPQHRHLPGSSPSVRVKFGGHVFSPPTVYHVTHGETASFLLTSADGCEQMNGGLISKFQGVLMEFLRKLFGQFIIFPCLNMSEYVWMSWELHT